MLLAGCSDDPSATSPDPSAAEAAPTDGSGVVDTTGAQRCAMTNDASQLDHTVAGHPYQARLHRPADTTADVRLPAVIDLHGLYSDGPTQAALTGFDELADRTAGAGAAFLVVEPTGRPGPIDGATGWEVQALEEPDRDDAEYLTQLIDSLVADHCADPSRIYLAGYSNGGFFAAEYACAHPNEVAAVAVVAGFDHPPDCTPAVPLVAFHGTADPVVPWAAGGTSILVTDQSPPAFSSTLARGVEPQLAESAAAAGCDRPPAQEEIADDVTMSTWSGCAAGADHVVYAVTDGGHTWPGAAEQPDADLIGATTRSIDATELIWEFFRNHPGGR